MLDAVLGAVIMVVATTSLLYSLELAERAFEQAGQHPLNNDEINMLRQVGITGVSDLEVFWRENIKEVPREVGLDE